MTWTMLAIRELGDGLNGVLHPIPTSEKNGIVLDEWDGRCAPLVTATRVELQEVDGVSKKAETILKAESVKVGIYITESRVAIACSRYDKGGGWVGGAPALALNAVSKARAAIRSQGKSLVGHVRYPWLSAVGFSPKTGWLSDETVRLVAADKSGGVETTYLLDLTLPKSVSSEKVAREIVQRSARFRLRRTSMDSLEERAGMEALLDAPERRAEKGQFALWRFGTHFFARESTAFGDLEDAEVQGVAVPPPSNQMQPPDPAERVEPLYRAAPRESVHSMEPTGQVASGTSQQGEPWWN